MSQTIDSKVVEMKFDNKNFEKNVAESMKTLENLDKRLTKLENTDVHLDKVGKAADSFDLSKLDKSLDAITHRFSVMGQVGASVIQNLTTDAYNLVKTFSSSIWNTTFGQIKSGGKNRAMNIAEAQFRIEGLGLNYDDYYDSIDKAVSGTAYGFDEAAVAASQFASSGVQAGKDMDHALRSISGMAAMTGRSYSDLAGVMEDAAAAGKVTNDTFSRLSERGLAALQEYAKRTNQTVEDVRKAAKEGEIAFVEFANVMDEAYGEHATKADETFTGVTSNIRAQLSRIGQTFYSPLIENNSDLIKMFQSVKKQIKALKEYTDPFAKTMADYVLKLSRWGKGVIDGIDVSKFEPVFQNATKIFNNLTVAAENLYSNVLKPFGKQFKAAFYEVFPSLNTGKGLLVTLTDKLAEASEGFRKFTSEIGLFGEKGLTVREALVGIFNALKLVFSILKGGISVVKTVLGAIFNLTGGLDGAITGLLKFVNIAMGIGMAIVQGIAAGLTGGIVALISVIRTIGHLIIDWFCRVLGIHSPSTEARDKVGKPIMLGIAEGILMALSALKTAIGTVVGWILEILVMLVTKIGNTIASLSGILSNSIGRVIENAFNLIANGIEAFNRAIEKVNTDKLNDILTFIGRLVIVGTISSVLISFAATMFNASRAMANLSIMLKRMASAFRLYMAGKVIIRLADMFKNLALAMGVMFGAIIIFASMMKAGYAEELYNGLLYVSLIWGELALLAMAASKWDFGKLKNAGVVFLSIGASVAMMGAGIAKVGKLDWKQILTALVSIGVVLTVLGAIMFKMGETKHWYSEGNWKLILSFCGGIWLVATAIKKVARVPAEDVGRATAVIAGIMVLFGIISAVMVAFSKLKYGEHDMQSFAGTFLAFGICIKMISNAVITLGFIPESKIDQGMFAVSKLVALMIAVELASYFASAAATSILIAVAAVLAAMAAVIHVIGTMEGGRKKAILGLTALMIEIGIFLKAVSKMNLNMGSLTSLGFVTIMLGVMGALVKIFGEMDRTALIQGGIAMIAVLGILTGVIYAWSKFMGMLRGGNTFEIALVDPKEKAQIKKSKLAWIERVAYIKTITHSIVEIALTIAGISKFIKSWDELIPGLVAVGAGFAALMLTFGALSSVAGDDKEKNLKSIAKAIRAIALVIIAIGGTLAILSMMDIGGMMHAGMAVAGILGVIALILKQSKVFGVQGMQYKPILAASVAIVAIGAALTFMTAVIGGDPKKWVGLAAAVGAIVVVLAVISKCMKAIDKVNISFKSVGAFLLSTLSLVAVAATIALFATYVEDMNKAVWAAGILAVVFFAMGVTLKIAETVNWKAAASIIVGTLSFVAIAGAIVLLANYTEDMAKAREAAIMMGLLLLEMGVVLGVLTAISMGTGGTAAAVILAIAAALAIMGWAMVEMAGGVYIGVAALEKLIGVLTPENAQQVVSFFETIGDGIGTAGQHIADGIQTAATAIHDAFAVLKAETEGVGGDFVGGFAKGIFSKSPIAIIAAAALGALAISGLKSKDGIDSASPSKKTEKEGENFDQGLGDGIENNSDLATNPAKGLGALVIGALSGSLSEGMASSDLGSFWDRFKSSFSDIKVNDVAKALNPLTGGISTFLLKTGFKGTFQSYGEDAVNSVKDGATKAATEDGGIEGFFSSLFSGLATGNFDNVLSGFDFSSILGENGIGGLKSYLDEAGVSMDNLSGDNIPKLIEKLKEGGLAGDGLIEALKELGITEDQLKDLGLAEKLGIEEAKDGIKDTEEALKSLADEIISGKFGNAPERWDKMFEHLVQSGKTAEEAYAAIADAQNEVNKRLGSSVVHTTDEMSKKVSESVKKANQAQADANAKAKGQTGKAGRDFKTDPFKSDSKVSKEDAAAAAEQEMLKNMPYENVKLAKEKQITAEREKQTVEAFKQKLANEHMYTLAEKQEALKNLKANEEIARQANLTTEKKKQLDAENARYQKVVDTYDEQQKMLKSIQDQEAATKKAEDAEKKRGDAVKASSGAVVYGSAEYYKQTGKTGMTINTMPTRKVEQTKPVEAETKVEVTPKFEVKNADVTTLKKEVLTKVETEFKDLQAKATITPKIDTAQAEAAISSLKTKTQDLKTTIPQTFSGIAAEVGKHLSTIASKITQEGGKIATNTKTVFQNAVSAAITTLNGSETITKFTNAGKAATQGYANGIRNNLALARSAGVALANTAIKAVKTTTKTNSPSKIYTQLGEWNGIGYGNGMLDSIGYVTNASAKMADASMDEVYRVVSAVEDAVSNGLDVNPTVTPVIDTTQIQNGIANMRSVMDVTSLDAAAISANMSAKASYDDSQVEEMRARMSEMRGAFNDLADVITNQPTPEVNANVILQGDADGVFKLVRNQDSIYSKMHGKSAFA